MNFLKKNIIGISLVVGVLFLLMILVSIEQIEFKKNDTNQIKKVVLYENLENKDENKDENFCDDVSKREYGCKELDSLDTCVAHSCCIWGKPKVGQKNGAPYCMSGGEQGPDENATIKNLAWWWYKGANKEAVKFPNNKNEVKESPIEQVPQNEPVKEVSEKVKHNHEFERNINNLELIRGQQALERKQINEQELMTLKHKQAMRDLESELKIRRENQEINLQKETNTVAKQLEQEQKTENSKVPAVEEKKSLIDKLTQPTEGEKITEQPTANKIDQLTILRKLRNLVKNTNSK